MIFNLNSLSVTHKVVSMCVSPGAFCIDATAGGGGDTEFLCRLVGDGGKVLAFDIQKAALERTEARVRSAGYSNILRTVLDSHSNMADYATPGSANAVMFNLGWLPGGDHKIFSRPETTIPAITSAMEIIKPGGVVSVCIYSGRESGYEEKNALFDFFPTIDNRRFTVLVSQFVNRTGDVPVPAFIFKNN